MAHTAEVSFGPYYSPSFLSSAAPSNSLQSRWPVRQSLSCGEGASQQETPSVLPLVPPPPPPLQGRWVEKCFSSAHDGEELAGVPLAPLLLLPPPLQGW